MTYTVTSSNPIRIRLAAETPKVMCQPGERVTVDSDLADAHVRLGYLTPVAGAAKAKAEAPVVKAAPARKAPVVKVKTAKAPLAERLSSVSNIPQSSY